MNWECPIVCVDLIDIVLLFSFAQWQYRSQWGLSEARLLLIENYTQYPALTAWNTADFAIFVGFYGSQSTNNKQLKNVLIGYNEAFDLTRNMNFEYNIISPYLFLPSKE